MESSDQQLELNRLSGVIVDCAFAVHTHLGPGMLEVVYQRALAIEFAARGIPFSMEAPVEVFYRDQIVGESRMDFLVANQIVVELKSVDRITDVHRAQVIHYLKATGLSLGLIFNFNCALIKDGVVRLISSPHPLRLCASAANPKVPHEQ